MTDEQPRARAKSDWLARNREAMAAAKPFNDQIASWQPQLARLRVLANRSDRTAEQRDDLVEEAGVLARQIYDQQMLLSATIQLMPPELASNSRLTDTRRAMNSASASVEITLALLAAPLS